MRTVERVCANCGQDYSPMLQAGGRLPRGFKKCPKCGGVNTEFVEKLYECGCCGAYHRKYFSGDCRDDNNRFGYGFHTLDEGGEK